MFTKKEHNMRVVLRELLSNLMTEEHGLKIADAIETDVFHEIMVNGQYANKFSEEEIGKAAGKVLCSKFNLNDRVIGRTFNVN